MLNTKLHITYDYSKIFIRDKIQIKFSGFFLINIMRNNHCILCIYANIEIVVNHNRSLKNRLLHFRTEGQPLPN